MERGNAGTAWDAFAGGAFRLSFLGWPWPLQCAVNARIGNFGLLCSRFEVGGVVAASVEVWADGGDEKISQHGRTGKGKGNAKV